jgi:hypothetical protein
MSFSLSPNDSQENVVDAVNYLLSNFKGSVSANNTNGQVTGPANQILSYLYKYLAVKYADSFDGQTNFSNSPTNRLYYGLRNTDSSVESTSYQDYVWTQVTGGFGTTKFFYYSVTGGRTIVVQIATTVPSANYVQESGSSIDLDISTVIPGGVITSVTGVAPISSSGGTTPAISISQSGTSSNGYLSSTDWNTFNNKQPAGTYVNSVTGSGNIASTGGLNPNITFTGVLPIANGGTNTTATPTSGAVVYGTGTAQAYTSAGSSGQFLTSSGGAAPVWTNATASAGAVGYYGSYFDTTTTTATSTTVAYVMGINTVDLQNGISIVSGNQITVANAGVYNLQFSAQLTNPNSSIADVSIWFRKNGVDIVDSAGTNGVPAKHGSNNGLQIISWNSIFSLNAGDYIQIVWHSDTANVQLITIPATTGPVVPESPALIVTIQAQSQIGIGYYGQTSTTSTTIGTGSKTFTVGIPVTSTAFTIGTRVRFAYTTTPSNFMEGIITSFSTTSMVVNVDSTGGSGTYAAWTVSIAGNQGNSGLTVNTTTVSGGTTGNILYDNAGTVGELTPAALTKVDDTNVTLTLGGTPATALLKASSLTLGWSGQLSVARGGTGLNAGTSGGVLYYSATGTLASSALLTQYGVVYGGGAGAAPVSTAAGTTGQVLTATTSGAPTWAAPATSGTVTTVSVVSANGFAGTVATATSTPAITLTTSITGVLKGNGTAISAAVANTDYVPLSTVLTKTADYTITNTDTWIINNKTGSALVLTFPAASSWTGRSITVKNMQSQLVNSASSNIVPIGSTTAGTAILLGVVGNWATVVSDGTNWVVMQAASNNNLLLE